jgi:methionine aminopeptidase
VKEATNTGIRAAGIDVQMCEIGEAIQEVSTALYCSVTHCAVVYCDVCMLVCEVGSVWLTVRYAQETRTHIYIHTHTLAHTNIHTQTYLFITAVYTHESP